MAASSGIEVISGAKTAFPAAFVRRLGDLANLLEDKKDPLVLILDEAGAELYACELAMKMFKREKGDLIPQVKDVISAMDFIDKSEGAQVIFI